MLVLAIKLILGCGIVVAALVGLRWASKRGMTARGGPALQVVGRTGLTRNALVAVLDVDGQRFLVGAGEQGVQLLAEIDGTRDRQDAGAGEPSDDGPTDTGDGDVLDLEALEQLGLEELDLDDLDDSTAHGSGHTDDGPRIGPLDRLREMTVRTHLREPIRAHRLLRR